MLAAVTGCQMLGSDWEAQLLVNLGSSSPITRRLLIPGPSATFRGCQYRDPAQLCFFPMHFVFFL